MFMSHHTKSPQEFSMMVTGHIEFAGQTIYYNGLARGIIIDGWYDVLEVSYSDISGDDGLDNLKVDRAIRADAEAALNRGNVR
jgi:hypothetical protein